MKISDIYAGKPDASDEIRERGYDEFANSYIKPSGINLERLASTKYGTPYFILGDKGTGKTALLHFITHYVHSIYPEACSSFLFFESDFTHVVREKYNAISKSISSSISVDNAIISSGKNDECDYTYVWKWQFYQKIIIDNELFNEGLFIYDETWKAFTRTINRISKTINAEKMKIPAKISVSAATNFQQSTITPQLSVEPVDFSQHSYRTTKGYREFVDVIEQADELVSSVKRTDVPYYIFIDELEAYRGENDTYYRDLRMIRDLLFIVKRMNDLFQGGTKFICSVRPEIMNAINRFVQSNQLHKIMQGYDERLLWEYTNTNSFNHPIIGILLRRIENAENKHSTVPIEKAVLIKKWFEPTINNTQICTYILQNSWHKPRDIVRLLLAAQTKGSKNYTIFNQSTFDVFMPAYSKQCLVEVREEMRALYSADDIECIVNCLQGFNAVFSYQEIVDRAKKMYPESSLANDSYTVLNDIYRIGIIGNVANDRHRTTRWEHKEQYRLLIDEPWFMIIHPALRTELSVSGSISQYIHRNKSRKHSKPEVKETMPAINDIVKGNVIEISKMNSNPEVKETMPAINDIAKGKLIEISKKNSTPEVKKTSPVINDIVKGKVIEISDTYILVRFNMGIKDYIGFIGRRYLGCYEADVGKINLYLNIDDTVTAKIVSYSEKLSYWILKCV